MKPKSFVAIRIVEHPTIERIRVWWVGLTPRERLLIGTLGALLTFAILVFGVVKPLQASRAESLADIRTYETLMARVNAAPALGPQATGPQPRTGTAAEIVTQSAASFGLQVQVEATPTGVRATVADAPYDAVVNWMADIARTSTLAATRVDIQKRPTPARVFAQIEYRG
ncbi:type II secretion system protein M [Roseomonas aeriglobus]|nr:type II secretion system protein M [Roseomonas aeriglobus]